MVRIAATPRVSNHQAILRDARKGALLRDEV
jgi:hypothetical protein